MHLKMLSISYGAGTTTASVFLTQVEGSRGLIPLAVSACICLRLLSCTVHSLHKVAAGNPTLGLTHGLQHDRLALIITVCTLKEAQHIAWACEAAVYEVTRCTYRRSHAEQTGVVRIVTQGGSCDT